MDSKEDIASVGDFIRLYTSRNARWLSLKFILGESYGTTRAAGLSDYLQSRYGFYLNGIILVSSALNFQAIEFTPQNNQPYILFLPSYAASAGITRSSRPTSRPRASRRSSRRPASSRPMTTPRLSREATCSPPPTSSASPAN